MMDYTTYSDWNKDLEGLDIFPILNLHCPHTRLDEVAKGERPRGNAPNFKNEDQDLVVLPE